MVMNYATFRYLSVYLISVVAIFLLLASIWFFVFRFLGFDFFNGFPGNFYDSGLASLTLFFCFIASICASLFGAWLVVR